MYGHLVTRLTFVEIIHSMIIVGWVIPGVGVGAVDRRQFSASDGNTRRYLSYPSSSLVTVLLMDRTAVP
jgi:hypothetical protein